jgi:imidazolonepropionase-like amidohydrolase
VPGARDLGTLEPWRLADLIVVDGNPLDDVKVLLEPQRIELVLKGGVVCVDRRAAPVPL